MVERTTIDAELDLRGCFRDAGRRLIDRMAEIVFDHKEEERVKDMPVQVFVLEFSLVNPKTEEPLKTLEVPLFLDVYKVRAEAQEYEYPRQAFQELGFGILDTTVLKCAFECFNAINEDALSRLPAKQQLQFSRLYVAVSEYQSPQPLSDIAFSMLKLMSNEAQRVKKEYPELPYHWLLKSVKPKSGKTSKSKAKAKSKRKG